MKTRISKRMTVVLIAVAILCIAAATAGIFTAGSAREVKAEAAAMRHEDKRARLPLVTVTGNAEYAAEADGLVYRGSVSAIGGNTAEADAKCNEHIRRAEEAFAPYGVTTETGRSVCGEADARRTYVYMTFTLTDISTAEEARSALIASGAELYGYEYSTTDTEAKTEALSLALADACDTARSLGGGRPVKVKELYCYADGCSAPGKVIYRASVEVSFADLCSPDIRG